MSARLWMVTRKHPPSVGGMQQLSFHLAEELRRRRPVTVIAWGGDGPGLALFLLHAFVRLLAGLVTGRIAALHLGDPALAALGWLPRLAGIPVVVTVHGLDITHDRAPYPAYLRLFFWRRMDAYVCISRHVAELVCAQGVDPARVHLVPVGVGEPPMAADPAAGDDAADDGALPPPEVFPVLALVGRLVERKGVPWFLARVAGSWLPRHPGARLLIAGDGPLRRQVERQLEALGLGDRARFLGEVSEPRKWALLRRADLVLMPNVPVAGDVEGFGIVALEAASVGTWVAVADLEGLRDAVADGRNGDRIPAGDAAAWSAALDTLCADATALRARGEQARRHVQAGCGWPAIAARYEQVIDALAPAVA